MALIIGQQVGKHFIALPEKQVIADNIFPRFMVKEICQPRKVIAHGAIGICNGRTEVEPLNIYRANNAALVTTVYQVVSHGGIGVGGAIGVGHEVARQLTYKAFLAAEK